MFKLFAICAALAVILSETKAGYASGGSSSGATAGAYGGSFSSDYIDGGFNFPGAEFAFGGIPDPYAFHEQLTAMILRQHAATQNAIAAVHTTGDASAHADASLDVDVNGDGDEMLKRRMGAHSTFYRGGVIKSVPSNKASKHKLTKSHGEATSSISGSPYGSGQGFSYGSGYGSGSGYAVASGSVGPGGYHQTAYINPANPAIPNIENRFGTGNDRGGYKGVSVSSYSSTSNVNGKPVNVRGASTTINDNGRIKTYNVHS